MPYVTWEWYVSINKADKKHNKDGVLKRNCHGVEGTMMHKLKYIAPTVGCLVNFVSDQLLTCPILFCQAFIVVCLL